MGRIQLAKKKGSTRLEARSVGTDNFVFRS